MRPATDSYYQRHREERLEYARRYYQKKRNAERRRKYYRRYYQLNLEHERKRSRQYKRRKRGCARQKVPGKPFVSEDPLWRFCTGGGTLSTMDHDDLVNKRVRRIAKDHGLQSLRCMRPWTIIRSSWTATSI
jgi:hypothetical protein